MSITITLDHIPPHISTAGLLTRVNMSDPQHVSLFKQWIHQMDGTIDDREDNRHTIFDFEKEKIDQKAFIAALST